MIVSKKASIIIFIALCSILFFLFALKSYLIILTLSSASVSELKVIAEKIFFWGLIGSLAVFASGLSIIIKSFMFEKSLDKLLVMSQTYGYPASEGLKKLGKLGKKLSIIYYELNSLSERKSKKISSLSSLISLIFSFIEKKVIIVSVTGEILFASESAIKGLNTDKYLSNSRITDFFPDFKFSAEADEISVSRQMKKNKEINADIYPVFNNNNDIDFLAFIFDEQASFKIITPSLDLINSIKKNRNNFNIKKLSSNFFRKKKS